LLNALATLFEDTSYPFSKSTAFANPLPPLFIHFGPEHVGICFMYHSPGLVFVFQIVTKIFILQLANMNVTGFIGSLLSGIRFPDNLTVGEDPGACGLSSLLRLDLLPLHMVSETEFFPVDPYTFGF